MTLGGHFGWKDLAFLPWGATHAALAGGEKVAGWAKGQAGSGDTPAVPPPTLDANAYQFGGAPGVADAAAGKAYGAGDLGVSTGQLAMQEGLRTGATGNAALAQGQAQQQQFTDNANAFNQRQTAQPFANQIAGLEGTEGPSAAQAQLQSGSNMAMAQQLALARSGRGLGGNAAAMSQAQGNMAGISANQANQAAGLRAQENAAWRQRQASNLGLANSQIMQGQGQNDAQVQAMLGMGLQANAQGQGTYLGARGQQNQNFGTTLGGIQTGLQGQQVANQVRDQQLQGSMGQQDDMIRIWAAQNGFNLQEKQRKDAQDAAILSSVSSGAAQYFGSGGGK